MATLFGHPAPPYPACRWMRAGKRESVGKRAADNPRGSSRRRANLNELDKEKRSDSRGDSRAKRFPDLVGVTSSVTPLSDGPVTSPADKTGAASTTGRWSVKLGKAGLDGKVERSGGKASGLEKDLDLKFQKLKGLSKATFTSYALSPLVKAGDSLDTQCDKKHKPKRKVTWADFQGAHLCTSISPHPTSCSFGTPAFTPQTEKEWSKVSCKPATTGTLSYKETLLKNLSAEKRSGPSNFLWSRARPNPIFSPLKNKCFRCLASDHLIRDCRDPLRCAACFRTGHCARHCPPETLLRRQTRRYLWREPGISDLML